MLSRVIVGLALIAISCWSTMPIAEADVDLGLSAYAARDYATAIVELEQAAALGHPEAQRVLGVMYLLGQGTPADPATAARWLRGAARLGNTSAQELMSYLYSQGIGVEQDYVQAYAWLKLVALRIDDQERATAIQATIARLTSTMDSAELQRARVKSREYYSKFLRPYL